MAIYHFSAKPVARGRVGRSVVAAAAYRLKAEGPPLGPGRVLAPGPATRRSVHGLEAGEEGPHGRPGTPPPM